MRIYIFCIEFTQTGGIELLHQLCHELNKQNDCEAIMYYSYDAKEKGYDPVPEAYKHYNNPYRINTVETFDDLKNAFFIVPEVRTWMFEEGFAFHTARHKCIYWESVDNHFTATPEEYQMGFLSDSSILHFAQSEYAKRFLIEKGISSDMILDVSDYLSEAFLRENSDCVAEYEIRKDVVLYNPAKGLEFTKKVIDSLPEITFAPIKGMSFEEVVFLMKKSKIYIDFGDHPGKDRIPREAAICGLVIITGRNGSAQNEVDVPIPDDCKFERDDKDLPAIADKIKECLASYDYYIERLEPYRKRIKEEPEVFSIQVKQAFDKMRFMLKLPVEIYVLGKGSFSYPKSPEYYPTIIEENSSEGLWKDKEDLYENLIGLYRIWKNRIVKDKERHDKILVGIDLYNRFLCAPNGESLLSREECNGLMEICDFILPESTELSGGTRGDLLGKYNNLADHIVHEVLLKKCPGYVGFWELNLRKTKGHYYCIFVTDSDIMIKFCTWLFDILFECEKELDRNEMGNAIMKHISEVLLDVYIDANGYKYYEVPLCSAEWGEEGHL